MRRVKILYEDQAVGPPATFGPHLLVSWLVWDELSRALEFHALARQLDPFPMKGATKLLDACRTKAALHARDGSAVLALFDADECRPLIGLPQAACVSSTCSGIRAVCNHDVRVVLLARNMETVTTAVRDLVGLAGAPRKESPNDRDRVLMHASGPAQSLVRSQLVGRVPDLQYLAKAVVGLLGDF